MPRFQLIPTVERYRRSTQTKYVTKVFDRTNTASYRVMCDLLLKNKLYSIGGQFKGLWTRAVILNTVYIAYLSIYRSPVAVAFIERGYDFGNIMPRGAEGFLGCYVQTEYRNLGVATKLCGLILEAGDFKCVTSESLLKKAIIANGVKHLGYLED